MFREAGIDARYIDAHTPLQERRELVDMFKAGDFPVLVNCGMARLRFPLVLGYS